MNSARRRRKRALLLKELLLENFLPEELSRPMVDTNNLGENISTTEFFAPCP